MKHTLGAAIEAGANAVSVHCAKCWKSKSFTAAEALARWKPEYTFPEIAQNARCSGCGREATAAGASWPRTHDSGGAPSTKPTEWQDYETRNPSRRLNKQGYWD